MKSIYLLLFLSVLLTGTTCLGQNKNTVIVNGSPGLMTVEISSMLTEPALWKTMDVIIYSENGNQTKVTPSQDFHAIHRMI